MLYTERTTRIKEMELCIKETRDLIRIAESKKLGQSTINVLNNAIRDMERDIRSCEKLYEIEAVKDCSYDGDDSGILLILKKLDQIERNIKDALDIVNRTTCDLKRYGFSDINAMTLKDLEIRSSTALTDYLCVVYRYKVCLANVDKLKAAIPKEGHDAQ